MTFDEPETAAPNSTPTQPAPLAKLALVDKAVIEVAKAEAGRIRVRSSSFADTEKVIPPGCELVVALAEGRCLVTVRESA